MSDYTFSNDFSVKDGLTTGNPSKKILGSDFDTEFEAIETAVATKADKASPTFTGTATFDVVTTTGTTTIASADINGGSIDNTTIGATTAQTGNFSTLKINGTSITATAAELNYVDGVTSDIQTQLNAKAPTASPTFTGNTTLASIVEGIATNTSGGTYFLGNAGASIVKFDLTASLNLGSTSFVSGEGCTVMFNTTSTITWPSGIKWAGGAAPTVNTGLSSGEYQVAVIWYDGTTHYGVYSGELT